MTQNKITVEKYMDGFRKGDHAQILSCLTDDVHWYMPGYFQLEGKEAFDKEINNEAFTGLPDIQIKRYVEEDNVVVAEGSVQCYLKDGSLLDALFCDVFEMREGRIKRLTTYQINLEVRSSI
ncbi:MAG TPA: nuclear transport factor 2 family protein [Chitinophagaceae bacterium]|nr:nuclear transport factor 2 family protein [Chitinophagaceae bacterium]